jgi:TPR repeat protein
MFQFVAQRQSADLYPDLELFATRTRSEAKAGDAGAQFLYGMLLAGFPQLGHKQKDALPWFLKAAQSGHRSAQYEVGSSLLFGMGCQCEEAKAEVWLRKAAEADQSDAQVTLGQYALRGTPDSANVQRAKLWLERAVASGHPDGMLYLSALLAATPVAELRDPPRALSLLEKVKKDLGGDPIEFEIRAAAQAASGQFAEAVRSEQRALAMAKGLQWDLTPLNERLARYQNGQAWYGNLLVL